jgi:acetylornithine deacetylase/succinyl-diaminopimelate desuccinylase-like protein
LYTKLAKYTNKLNCQERWTHDPFGAEKDGNGNIYARGAQDMKSIGVQYLEAIRVLKAQSVTPIRNVHVLFVPGKRTAIDLIHL